MLKHRSRVGTLALSALLVVVCGQAAPAGAAEEMAVDESRIDALARSVAQERATFAGMSIDDDGTIVVRYAGSAGRAAARARLAAHTGVTAGGGKRSKVRLVEVARSTEQLDAVREQIKTDTTLKPVISRYSMDVERNVVSVGVTEITPQVARAVRDRFGARVELHVAARAQRLGRTNDTQPWDGGILIHSSLGGGCTGGYVVRSLSVFNPVRQLVTAGHCGPTGTVWRNGNTPVGTTAHSEWTDHGYDYARIGGSAYTARTYTGSVNSNTTEAIGGSDLPILGKRYCTNGAVTGEVCWGTVIDRDACAVFRDGVTTCHLDALRPDNRKVMATEGDSGGAVIKRVGGKVLIAGIIVGADILNNDVYFHAHDTLFPAPSSNWVVDISA
ncbi:hypothetical protein ABNF97_13935 [Plantactinospora sp. B6F1]|uniref:hypothetical protein n=1 Tax=Plantactinospora sp. B6F1 TaxID=3158971 RepID=UPI00102B89E6